ncbi:ABC transporter permease [Actinoplanes auranticolor]|uniref:Glycine/betaine ABC transporter permease n=1 Tax=Actinoplanes auranticolor TaxID=47988 RepID=A0A919SHR0_9ACTN|nr:ABC transporter permease subunit [Actinoplanes auranticolor]GIM71894.1 glycine/betaine ABC transporter permease [Actinoplanes auranticolor]
MVPDVPVDAWVTSAINWLRTTFAGFFDAVAELLRQLLNGMYQVLVLPHPLLLTAILVAIAWLSVRRWVALPVATAGLLLVQAMDLWTDMLQSLAVVLVASAVAVVVGVPLGILAARNDRVRAVVRPVMDFMQTMPVFVYLLPAVFFFGIGVVPGVVATTIFAVPPAVRLTDLGIRQVDAEVVEAAAAFGARPRQILRDVQLPLALPSIMTGVNQVIMLALSMVVVAGLVGGGGLGAVVVRAITQLDIGRGFEGGLAVVVLAIYLDRVTASLGRRLA